MKLKAFLMKIKSPTPAFLPTVMILLFALALVGCAGNKPATGEFTPTPVEVVVKVPYECGQPPPLPVVNMRDIEWQIVEIDGEDYFTLTVEDYQALGMNTSDWIAASRKLKEQRDFLQDCIDRSKAETEAENTPEIMSN